MNILKLSYKYYRKLNDLFKSSVIQQINDPKERIKRMTQDERRKYFRGLESLEDEFEKYTDYDYKSDVEDLEDDMHQKGYMGIHLLDDEQGEPVGQITGYDATEDELEDFDFTGSDIFFKEHFPLLTIPQLQDILSEIREKVKNGKVFYVSNFVMKSNLIDKKTGKKRTIKHYIKPVLANFLSKIKEANYEFICFDALSDTKRLLLNPDGTVKKDRLGQLNLEIFAQIPSNDGTSCFFVLKFTD